MFDSFELQVPWVVAAKAPRRAPVLHEAYGRIKGLDASSESMFGFRWLQSLIALLLGAVLAVLLGGCGALPPGIQRTPSAALAPSTATALGKIAAASTPSADQSGVRLLPLGLYSLDTRLQLAQRAQASLDVQYYQLENDSTGRLLMRHLRDAARRGVRVRLLVDDLYTTHSDGLLRALSAHPNIEVRLYNPFCCARGGGVAARYAASLFDFGRLNHRMHNKMFIADGVMGVVGGRNIADEYFLRHAEQNFVDIDAFVMGQVVGQMASIFDAYWNSDVVVPIEAVGAKVAATDAEREAAQAYFNEQLDTLPPSAAIDLPEVDVLGYGPLAEDFDAGRVGLVWGKARAFADPPDKLLKKTAADAYRTSVTNDVVMTLWLADSELVLTSPYLIPGPAGMQSIAALRAKGVKITIMTNSLAATDEPLVHTGYARYRNAMLKEGVELYEISPTRTQQTKRLGMFGTSLGRLHAKTAVVDRKTIFIGSMNLDPRSASSNTEFGMFIDSPAAAKELLRVINISRLESAYRVRIEPKGSGLQWLTTDGDKEVILVVEPESSWWLRIHNFLFGLFVPEQLL
jgi:cardiolipin synthase C